MTRQPKHADSSAPNAVAPTPSRAPNAGERALFAVAVAASLVLLLIIAWPMLQGGMCTFDDLGNMHIPYRIFFARCNNTGHLPYCIRGENAHRAFVAFRLA